MMNEKHTQVKCIPFILSCRWVIRRQVQILVLRGHKLNLMPHLYVSTVRLGLSHRNLYLIYHKTVGSVLVFKINH